jgi:hypothetical protein
MAAVLLVAWLTPLAFLWYNVVSAVTVFVTGLLISAVSRSAAAPTRTSG